MISLEIFCILLSERMRTVRLGHLSKSVNEVIRLKDNERVSRYYELGN
jgi:hypothetical protein